MEAEPIEHLSTIFLCLEATVRKAQAKSELVVSILFDIEKAYNLRWRHGILIDINDTGIEGRMFNFIQNFLEIRSFKDKVNEILSDSKILTEGIPQRRVVSPIFPILKTNKIVGQLSNDNRFLMLLYMDDLHISYRHPKWRVVERKLQNSIKIVGKIAQKNGFKFSTSKTYMLHFTKLSILPPIELLLGNIGIQKFETVKYLGLALDSELDWESHIQLLKS